MGDEMLSDRDQIVLARYREEPKVLVGLEELTEGSRLRSWWMHLMRRASQGYHFVVCGDCDFCEDGILHIHRTVGRRSQLHAHRGGALLLDPACPENAKREAHRHILEDMVFVKPRKQLDVAILRVDFPCGLGHAHQYSPERTLEGALQAKHFLVREGWAADDIALLYYRMKDGLGRTYLIDEEAALAEVTDPFVQI